MPTVTTGAWSGCVMAAGWWSDSDILESAIVPTWESVARLGAVAAIRTFLNYFLERDLREVMGLDHLRQGETGGKR